MVVDQISYHVDPKYFKTLEPRSHASHISKCWPISRLIVFAQSI